MSQLNQDFESKLAELEAEKTSYMEREASLSEQLSQAEQEIELANRLLEESRAQIEEMKKRHAEKVCDSLVTCIHVCMVK